MSKEKKKLKKKIKTKMPLQHILEGNWKISEYSPTSNTPHVSITERTGVLPLGTDETDRLIRLHEAGHVKWSPPREEVEGMIEDMGLGDIEHDIISQLEDFRINRALEEKYDNYIEDNPVRATPEKLLDYIEKNVDTMSEREKITSLLSISPFTGLHKTEEGRKFVSRACYIRGDLRKALSVEGEQVTSLVVDEMHGISQNTAFSKNYEDNLKRFRQMLRNASHLQSYLNKAEKEEKKEEKYEEEGKVKKTGRASLDDVMDALSALGPDKRAAVREELEDKTEGEGTEEGRTPYDRGEWGTLEMVYPPLEVSLISKKKTMRHYTSDMGLAMRNPHRVLTDGKVFMDKRRKQGGTLLIDVSGSMHLSTEDIEEIVAMAPLATIAIYSGSGRMGWVKIVAKDGKRATKERIRGMPALNVIDGPALQWLEKQQHPRVWVCDGKVTGINDKPCHHLTSEAYDIAVRARVLRIPSMREAVEFFQSKSLVRT